ncbi:MAG: hypothetical protein V4631_15210 [Pseudomonadota bacterium]
MLAPTAEQTPCPAVRATVRDLLSASSAYHTQDPETRRTIAGSLVRIANTAKTLAEVDQSAPARARLPLAMAQNAGSEFSGVSASRVADTTRSILNAVSFPRFVTDLINGVFRSLNDSNQQQLHSFVELIQNVAATTEGFADANIGISGARAWLAERFPANFMVQGGEADDFGTPPAQMTPEERAEAQAERDAGTRLVLRPGASMPTEAALRTVFGLGPQDSVGGGNPENLVPLARANMARSRQQMLSTMVMMGLQRIVVESGKLNASMRFHIDTRSAANDDRGSSFDFRNDTSVGVGAKVGPWGVEGKMQNTVGYVSTERTQTTEEMNTEVDMNSSVELIFKTDYVALDRLAGGPAQERIRVNAINPEAEANLASADRQARRTSQAASDASRSSQLSQRLVRPTQAGAIPANVPAVTPDAAAPVVPPTVAAVVAPVVAAVDPNVATVVAPPPAAVVAPAGGTGLAPVENPPVVAGR